ncbi:hypothetical protein COOONC_07606 [Cooperia oncophora]
MQCNFCLQMVSNPECWPRIAIAITASFHYIPLYIPLQLHTRDITLHTYHITLKSIVGNLTQAAHWACPPRPFCEQMQCNFCLQMVSNPECWPRIAIAITASYVKLFRILASIRRPATSSSLLSILRCPQRTRRTSVSYIPLLQLDKINNTWNTRATIRLIATLTCLIIPVHSCQQTVLLLTMVSQCDPSNNNCHNQTTVIIRLIQMQPDACLQLKYGDKQFYFMRISMYKLVLRCRKETLYFTRNTIRNVQYKKRCPHMGTCSGNKCAKISFDKLFDNPVEAVHTDTLLPSSGCLFYRIYQDHQTIEYTKSSSADHDLKQSPSRYKLIPYNPSLILSN